MKADTCCHHDESAHDALRRNVFSWTVVAVCLWGSLPGTAQWTVAWWGERWHVITVLTVVTTATVYFWVRLLRERGHRRESGGQ